VLPAAAAAGAGSAAVFRGRAGVLWADGGEGLLAAVEAVGEGMAGTWAVLFAAQPASQEERASNATTADAVPLIVMCSARLIVAIGVPSR
jgi:hypothetical protein